MKLTINDLQYIICESKRLLSEITIKDAYDRYYKDIDNEVYLYIASIIQPNDKNNLHQNTQWVLSLYKENPQETINSLPLLSNENNTGYLQIFNRLVILNYLEGNERSIKNYKNIEQLKAKVSQFSHDDLWGDNAERKKRVLRQEFKDAKDNINLIYEDAVWKVLIPNSYEASCYWGNGTKWCTAYKDDDSYYKDYASQGNLYINVNVKTGEKYQFHFETSSFKDKNDEEIDEINDSENLLVGIGATKGMIQAYKKVLPKEAFRALVSPTYTYYENEYFMVNTQYRVVANEATYWDTDNRFDEPPLKLFYKNGGELEINNGSGCEGFTHFYDLKNGKYLLGIVVDDGDYFFHILTLKDIMSGELTEDTGEAYCFAEQGSMIGENGEVKEMINNHPETTEIINKINKHFPWVCA